MLLALTVFALFVGGCSDFDEMKSQRSLAQAETLMKQGNELEAEQALIGLIAKYPRTQSAEKAGKLLSHIKKHRELRERREFAKVLDSYRQVLNGYHALYAEYPRSVDALDQSDYFFDSSYLKEITPEGYQVYFFLQTDGSGYLVWCVSEERELGYVVNSMEQKLIPFNRAQTLEELKTSFNAEGWNEKVVILHSR
jgi:hypothetical protein